VRLADELVRRAKQTGATVTFIEDPELLQDYGGVAGLLRFRI
jgi:peptide subunit release factor 1 (eRF1)